MSVKRTVLVTGATGNQGSAVANALLSRGHSVRAFTRNPKSPAAIHLAGQGAELAIGDFSDTASVRRAASGADTVFAMGTPFGSGVEEEIKQGMALADAARAAGLGHLIYASGASADRHTGIPYSDSKYQVERYIASLGVPYTISAPVFFMENLVSPWFLPALRQGKLTMALPAARKLQQIAVTDIGEFVAALVDRREAVFGQRFDIAGDELSGEEMAGILSRVSGREIHYEGFPAEALRAESEDSALVWEWFDRVGFAVDIGGLRRDFPEVHWHRFEDWARERDWSALLEVSSGNLVAQ
jgi:uncharacterized protein YbjT (DUF2867 family)